MGEQITFRGELLWDSDTTGAGWDYEPGPPPKKETIEARAPLGTGYWLKPAGVAASQHKLKLAWHATAAATVRAALAAADSHYTGSLVVPGHGTFAKLRLSSMSSLKPKKSGNAYLVECELTFEEYP
jgi:hypothetical protein